MLWSVLGAKHGVSERAGGKMQRFGTYRGRAVQDTVRPRGNALLRGRVVYVRPFIVLEGRIKGERCLAVPDAIYLFICVLILCDRIRNETTEGDTWRPHGKHFFKTIDAGQNHARSSQLFREFSI